MNDTDPLSQLLQAERAERRSDGAVERGWRDLNGALDANVTELAVAHGPLKLGLSAATKWVLGSGLAVVVGVGVAHRWEPPPRPTPAVAVSPSTTAPTLPAPLRGPPEPALAAATTSTSSRVGKRPPEPDAAPSAAPSASTAASTLADELRLVKAAKLALDGGRAHLAEVWLDQHARLYPEGILRGEREALRVLLTCQQGSGRDAAQSYVARHPQSPFLDRIARACQLDQAAPPGAKLPDSAAEK